ncbi:MAG: hypothetical protein HOC71_15150 [Candidatus Latescibacteria bacterium]|jgi:hypothetical protein|nr:hypothetical protein [Candidatus Latescibacterota bacterium]
MKEKKWGGVTRSPEEDIALFSFTRDLQDLTFRRFIAFMVTSILIIVVYLLMNSLFYPDYPVVTMFAEKSEVFEEHYPPFRMSEWINYSITKDIIENRLFDTGSFSRTHPIGFSMLAAPLTSKWGESGIFYTNAFILWICSLVFFFLMLELVEFYLALASTIVLAFATPNLFYASSAFGEPVSQLLTIMSVFFFIKGMIAHREWIFYSLCGFTIALNLFVQPSLALSVVLFAVILMFERGKWSLTDRSVMSLCSGYLIPLAVFFVINKIYLGNFSGYLFTTRHHIYDFTILQSCGENSNVISGIWEILFDNPYGLLFVMPVVMLVPMGLAVMWRIEMRPVSVIVGVLFLYSILLSTVGSFPVTAENIGSKHLVPAIPLLVIPLAFMWREKVGEKIWLAVTLAMTVYMCSFGWWTGKAHGKGFFIGALQDREAKYIILARKNRLKRPEFMSSNKLVEKYIHSLKTHDIKTWLETVDLDVLAEIRGFERTIFTDLCRVYNTSGKNKSRVIESADPDKGIRPVLTDIYFIGD